MLLRNTNVAFKLETCGLRCATILKVGEDLALYPINLCHHLGIVEKQFRW